MLSLIIPTCHGLTSCIALQYYLSVAERGEIELLLLDGAIDAVPLNRPGVRHLIYPGLSVFALKREGILAATGEWIVLSEDHAEPLPGFLDALRDIIASNDDRDLFIGSVVNTTSTSPSSMAQFLFRTPRNIGSANLAVRRRAILDSELAWVGGFESETLPRLMASGRSLRCTGAVINHVQHCDLARSCRLQFHNSRFSAATGRRSVIRKFRFTFIGIFILAAYRATVLPLNILLRIKKFRLGWQLLPRVPVIGVANAAGLLLGFFFGAGNSEHALE